MLNFKVSSCYALIFILPINMVGCSSINKDQSEKTRMLGVPVATVETDPVILDLEAAVRKSPKNADTWSRLTKAYFDSKHYDQAIQAGNMALELNPDNADTRNIVFVSGLRIASASLDGIRKDQPLTGSNLADATTLVGTIRQTLGETSLTDVSSAPPVEKPTHSKKKKKTVRLIAHERSVKHVKSTSNRNESKLKHEEIPASNAIVISNKPVTSVAQPTHKSAVQASANNPFGAFQ